MTPRMLGLGAALLGVALISPSAHAQGRGGGFRGRGAGAGARAGRRGGSRPYYGYGWGYLPPPYYDDGYESGYVPAEPPYPAYPVAAEQPPAPAPEPKPIVPLLIEEGSNGQWVRVPNGSDLPAASTGAPQSQNSAVTAAPAPKLPPAVIVFRDGHQEEVERYTIQGNVLYTGSDYWRTGSWTRKIPVSDLDIPATLKVNQDRGAKFDLPSSPSQIMVRF